MWLRIGLREGKNREVRTILETLGLAVNRLIRISFGPFQLLDLEPGAVEPVKRRVLMEQLGPRVAAELGLTDEEDAPRPAGQGPAQAQGLGMRIVGGQFRGRPLAAPGDDRTRPTSDRVREAVFNILAHGIPDFALDGAKVLDLFAGTGALGLEALSRGAAFCLFVEEDAEARALIRRNVEALGADRRHQDLPPRRHRSRPRRQERGGFALVFLDPPYGQGLAERALASAAAGGWLAPGAIAVIEERKGTAVALPAGFALLDRRTWGDTEVTVCALRRRQGPSRWRCPSQIAAIRRTIPSAAGSRPASIRLRHRRAQPRLRGRPPDRRAPDRLHPLRHGRVGADAARRHRPRARMRCASCWRRRAGWSASAPSASRSSTTSCSTTWRPPHGSLLVRLAIPLAMVVGWVLFARRPPRLAMIGAGVVFLGIAPLSVHHRCRAPRRGRGGRHRLGALLDLRSFAAEFHPWNRRATTVMEKLRVTGLVVLVTSLTSLALAGVVAALDRSRACCRRTSMMPTGRRCCMCRPSCSAWLVGSVVLTAMAVLSFSAVVKITTENLMAVHAFTPVATLLVQMAATAVGLIPAYALDPSLLAGDGRRDRRRAHDPLRGAAALIFPGAGRH